MDLQQYLADISLKTMSQLHRAIVHLTGGQVLGSAFGMPVVELHTVGRKSGQPRSTMLTAPVTEGDRVVLVASKGGDDRDPDWYRNLIAHPDIELTMAGRRLPVRARRASPQEKAELWPRVVAAYTGYGSYRAPHPPRHPAGHLRAALNARRGWRRPLPYGGPVGRHCVLRARSAADQPRGRVIIQRRAGSGRSADGRGTLGGDLRAHGHCERPKYG